MDSWIWCAAAFALLGTMVRVSTWHQLGKWQGRILTLCFSLGACLMVHLAINPARLDAIEAANSTYRPMRETVATWANSHYDPILLPVYALTLFGLLQIVSQLLANILPAQRIAPSATPWSVARVLAANVVVLVTAPAVAYWIASAVTGDDSIIGRHASAAVMPIVATYGAPAYWLNACFGVCNWAQSASGTAP
jgi:hypothetical protein